MRTRLALLIGMVFGAAAMRLLPHPPNFDAIGAIALFGGAQFDDKRWALGVPLAAMLLSDAVIGFHGQMHLVYASFALIVCIGFLLRERKTLLPVTGAAVASSVLFFLLTNFGVWAFDALYPKTIAGLFACYVAAIPFLGNTLAGNLFYVAVLFGGFALAERKVRLLAPVAKP